MDKSIECKNCQATVVGKYCSECGQKAKTARITIKQVFTETRQHFIHFDQGFMHTVLELAKRPGHMIQEYLGGKRAGHTKPIKFLFLATTLSFLVVHFSGMDKVMIEKMATSEKAKQQQFTQQFMQYVFDHPALVNLFLIPLLAWFSWMILRKRGHNYAEHFVMYCFLMGELSLLTIITVPLFFLTQNILPIQVNSMVSMLIWVLYIGWTLNQIYAFKHKITGFLRSTVLVSGSYLLLIILISIITLVALFFFRSAFEGAFSQ